MTDAVMVFPDGQQLGSGAYYVTFTPIPEELQEPPADPEPDPPTAEPEPAPPLGAPPFQPMILPEIVAGAHAINSDAYIRTGRYNRSPRIEEWFNGQMLIEADVQPLGKKPIAFQGTEYVLEIDGVPAMTLSVTEDQWNQGIIYEGPQPYPLSHGWHYLRLVPKDGEVSIPWFVFVHAEGGGPDPQWLPMCTNSQRVVMHGDPFVLQVVPNRFQPVPRPLVPRDCPAFDYEPDHSDMFLTQIAHHQQLPRYPVRLDSGAVAINSGMSYFSGIVTGPKATMPAFDGPRGVGTVGPAMFVFEGEADCDGHPTLYVLESHRFIRIRPNGEVTTLVGKRSRKGQLPSEFHGAPVFENVGDWRAIPADRHDFAEGWSVTVDPTTVGIDTSKPRIASEGNQHPHFADAEGFGPVMYLTDSLHQRVLRLEFSATVRPVPNGPLDAVRVTEWTVPGEYDIWSMDAHPDRDGKMIAADRKNHRVVVLKHNPDTGQAELVETLLQGESRAFVTDAPARHLSRGGDSEAYIREQPIVLPERIRVLGRDVYISSGIQERIVKQDCDTKEHSIYLGEDVLFVGKNFTYLDFDISDGSCYQRGTVGVANWTASGGPIMYRPDGERFYAFRSGGEPALEMGAGGFYRDPGYISTMSFGRKGSGAMYWNTVYGGMRRLSLATPDDPRIDNQRWRSATKAWEAKGYQDRFGPTGNHDWFGEPLPWGESEDIDYFLTACDHSRADS